MSFPGTGFAGFSRSSHTRHLHLGHGPLPRSAPPPHGLGRINRWKVSSLSGPGSCDISLALARAYERLSPFLDFFMWIFYVCMGWFFFVILGSGFFGLLCVYWKKFKKLQYWSCLMYNMLFDKWFLCWKLFIQYEWNS